MTWDLVYFSYPLQPHLGFLSLQTVPDLAQSAATQLSSSVLASGMFSDALLGQLWILLSFSLWAQPFSGSHWKLFFPDIPLGSVHFHNATGFHHCSLWFFILSLVLPGCSVTSRRQLPQVQVCLFVCFCLIGKNSQYFLHSQGRKPTIILYLLFFSCFSHFSQSFILG